MFDKIDLAGVFPNGENTDSDLFMVFVDAADKVWITGGGGVVRCVYRNGRLSADGFGLYSFLCHSRRMRQGVSG